MAYAHPFHHDVFVSYARADDKTAVISRFVESIRKDLANSDETRFEGEHDVYIDYRQVPRSEDFERHLAPAIRNSAVFVAFLSEDYFKSEWCGPELKAWLAKEGGAHAPLLLVWVGNTPAPSPSHVEIRFENLGIPGPLHRELFCLGEDDQAILAQIRRDLRFLREKRDAAPTVFLAEAHDQYAKAINCFETCFEQGGIRVIRMQEPSDGYQSVKFRLDLQSAISNAHLFFQMVTDKDGGYPAFQRSQTGVTPVQTRDFLEPPRTDLPKDARELATEPFLWTPPEIRGVSVRNVRVMRETEAIDEAIYQAKTLQWQRGNGDRMKDVCVLASSVDYTAMREALAVLDQTPNSLRSDLEDLTRLNAQRYLKGKLIHYRCGTALFRKLVLIYKRCAPEEIYRYLMSWDSMISEPNNKLRAMTEGVAAAVGVLCLEPPDKEPLRLKPESVRRLNNLDDMIQFCNERSS